MGLVFGFYFNILCIWMLFSWGFFSSCLLEIRMLRRWGRGQHSIGVPVELQQRAGVAWRLGFRRCEATTLPHAWLQPSVSLCFTPQPTRVCTIPSGKITFVARGCICMEINNQSREKSQNKEQYPAITFLDFHRVFFQRCTSACSTGYLCLGLRPLVQFSSASSWREAVAFGEPPSLPLCHPTKKTRGNGLKLH